MPLLVDTSGGVTNVVVGAPNVDLTSPGGDNGANNEDNTTIVSKSSDRRRPSTPVQQPNPSPSTSVQQLSSDILAPNINDLSPPRDGLFGYLCLSNKEWEGCIQDTGGDQASIPSKTYLSKQIP